MDKSRVSSVIGSRNRERFRIDNEPMFNDDNFL